MKPIARTDRLIKQEVEQETLVYDRADDTACCLNALASAVWRRCDGKNTVTEIAQLVAREMTLPAGADPEAIVWKAVEELEEHDLVAWSAEDTIEVARAAMDRRHLVRALAAIPLFPAIQQITAPNLADAVSPPTTASATPGLTQSVSISQSVTATNTMTQTMTRTMTQSVTRTQTMTPTRTLPPPAVTQSMTMTNAIPPTPTPTNTLPL
jgi:hypothetical protein